MKFFLKMFFLAILISNSSFAKTIPCPSVEQIRNANFVDAVSWLPTHWSAMTQTFIDNGNKWAAGAVFDFDSDNKKDALNYVQHQIQVAPLAEPSIHEQQNEMVCYYTEDNSFLIMAIYPADSKHAMNYLKR